MHECPAAVAAVAQLGKCLHIRGVHIPGIPLHLEEIPPSVPSYAAVDAAVAGIPSVAVYAVATAPEGMEYQLLEDEGVHLPHVPQRRAVTEGAAVQAMCDFRGLEVYMFFTGGDLLDAPEWTSRSIKGQIKDSQHDPGHFDIALALAEYAADQS